jgi:hypothetical protein
MLEILNLAQKQKLAKKVKPFTLKKRIMYRVGQDKKMHRCLTTSKAQIILKWRTPKLLDGLDCESKGENIGMRRSWGALLGSQHFGVEGRVGAPGWD